ncbi:MAG: hypothetical protein M5U18_19690 [Dehalococcoidia bacterium]|nr:hypothetical protein [Dehalococcoidia bacterium]
MNLDDPSGDVDERPQRRREYSGASSTLGVAALIILTVGVAIWWFQFREDDSSLASDGYGVIALPADLNPYGSASFVRGGPRGPGLLARFD